MADGDQAPNELTTWGEIAGHLGVSVRTAQKWEAGRGLPVRRLAGPKGRVLADRAELERWREATLGKPAWWAKLPLLRAYAAVSTSLLLVCVGILYGLHLSGNHKGPPTAFRHELNTLIVSDSRGHELWRRTFPDAFQFKETPESLLSARRVWFGDLEGDGRAEMLYIYQPVTRDKEGTTLYCFSEDGAVKWQFKPGKAVRTTPDLSFKPPYLTERLVVLKRAGRSGQAVAVTSHHLNFHPNQVALLSQDGRLLSEYWHSGHLGNLDTADLDGDGVEEILLAGVNNGYKSATLVVLDPREMGGASAEEDPKYQLQGFGLAREKARILFPRTCLNRKLEEYNVAEQLSIQQDLIQVGTKERILPVPDPSGVIYFYTWRLELSHMDFSDRLRVLHRELELAGAIDHRYSPREVEELRSQIRVLRGRRIDTTPGLSGSISSKPAARP